MEYTNPYRSLRRGVTVNCRWNDSVDLPAYSMILITAVRGQISTRIYIYVRSIICHVIRVSIRVSRVNLNHVSDYDRIYRRNLLMRDLYCVTTSGPCEGVLYMRLY